MRKPQKQSVICYAVGITGAAMLLLAGCSGDSFQNSPASPAADPSQPGITFLQSPSVPLATALGDETSVTKTIKANKKGDLKLGEFKVKFEDDSFGQDTDVMLSLVDEEQLRFQVGPATLAPAFPIEIEVKLNQTDFMKCSGMAIFRLEDGEWVALDCEQDGNKLTGTSDALGEFAVGHQSATGAIEFLRYLSGPGYETELIEADKGGKVEYDRYKVEIPKHALSEDTYITVRDPGSNYLMCELEPHGIEFAIPVEFTMDCKDLELDPYTDWTIFWFDVNLGIWVDQEAVFSGDDIEVYLDHFSRYGAGRAGW